MNSSEIKAEILNFAIEAVDLQLASGESFSKVNPYNLQVIRGLAYLYTLEGSPFKEDGRIADEIRLVAKAIENAGEEPGNRLTGHLADTRVILRNANATDLAPNLDALLQAGAEPLFKRLNNFKYLTHLTSGNQGTSTNHSAVFGCSVFRVGQEFNNDEYIAIARDTWDRLCADQSPDGFWAETTPGPAVSYNNLTYACAGRMARWTGAKHYQEAALKGAAFHRRFCYPDTSDLETIDGRVRYHATPHFWGEFIQSQTPEGTAYVARKMKHMRKVSPPATVGTHGGERIALLCENHQLWIDGEVGTWQGDQKSHADQLQQLPGGVRREGPWQTSFQGIAHLPRGFGGFTIDRTSVFSLWHEKTGLIINGSGEPGPNKSQSFLFNLKWDPEPPAVPELAKVNMGKPGSDEPAHLHAEYRGGTVNMKSQVVSEDELRLQVQVGANKEYYPVEFTLQLELHDGDTINATTLGTEPFELDADQLSGKIETNTFSLTFPQKGARLIWPHDPYNPYNKMDHFKSGRGLYVALLKLPVYWDPIELVFRVS